MSSAPLLRAAAVLFAIVAIVEPSCAVTRMAPLAVEVRPSDVTFNDLAREVRERLRDVKDVVVESPEEARAIVIVGDRPDTRPLPTSVPVSLVEPPSGPNVIVREIATTSTLMPGWMTAVRAIVHATGMAGSVSIIALEHQGVQLAHVEHRWTMADETFEARFEHVPPEPGTSTLRVVAKALDKEVTPDDNHGDVQLNVEDRKLRVLFYEPRPSWTTTFVRRVVEQEPLFDVGTLARPARGIEARTAGAPERLSPRTLEPFDAVVVAAPEELRQPDLDALDEFSRLRGGAVLLMPDRRPSGAYAKLLPVRAFDEVLAEKPATLQGDPSALKCSEVVVLSEPAAGVDVLAALPRQNGVAPAIVSWPNGAGRIIFSGCLDGWRYRNDGNAFARFWTARIAEAAAAAPRKLELVLEPAPALPGQTVRVTARLRHTEFAAQTTTVKLPAMSGRATGPGGSGAPFRLWPTAESGVYEGRFVPATGGSHTVEVTAADSVAAKALFVEGGVRSGGAGARESLRALAAATGGVIANPGELSELEDHLSRMSRPAVSATVEPSRSVAWGLGVIGLLSAEWWLRRRQGRV